MTYRLRNILLAVVLAVLAAFLTALYVANYQNRVDAGQEKVKVLVAKTDIAPGMAAGDLRGKVSEKEILRKNVVPVAVSDLESIEGQASSQWIYSGEQLSARRFSLTGRSGIHGELKGNFRAIQVSGTQHQLLAGILRAGDHVDIVANLDVSDDARVGRIVLRDLRVLRASSATGISSGLSEGGRGGGYAVVLQVTDSQAHKLFFVTSNEDHAWSLQLRPVTDATDSPESISTLPSVLRAGLRNQSGR